ncbi:hypothetical protein THRCLA_00528 [Thraustotheca clavata]|uniref:Secreted protein n=1 Tax=Thraustotheca clavata TaxID=74557 RepID=A0A0A7CLQ3_9STRA|nr:secreted protein [Thraustotheca clavata]OQS07457.1 hypothetical protein THRCLA_00528 [Thraustotheca clavata]
MVSFLLRGIAVAAMAAFVMGACPNKCSGHGTCGANDVCNCEQNWVNADCSGRLCPFARAWQDTAKYNNDAHYYTECSGRGYCDRSTGVCQCDNDFTGSGCRRMRCPNDCSGHGVCYFIEELAVMSSDQRIGGNAAFTTFSSWEREKIQGCKCDPGWEGYACNLRVCPKGDDPLTVNDPVYTSVAQVDQYQAIILTGATASTFVLKYQDPDGNTWTTSAITSTAPSDATPALVPTAAPLTCTAIANALQMIPNLALYSTTLSGEGQISVTPGTANPITRTPPNAPTGVLGTAVPNDLTHISCIVAFPAGPGTTGYQFPLICDTVAHTAAGSQPMSAGTANTCQVVEHYPPGGTAAAIVTAPYTELAPCSNRGVCSGDSGECTCFPGHKGLACELQEALV